MLHEKGETTYRSSARPKREQEMVPMPPLPSALKPPSRTWWRVTRGAFISCAAIPPVVLSLLAMLGISDLEAFGILSLGGLVALYVYSVRSQSELKIGQELDRINGAAVQGLEDDPAGALAEFAKVIERSGRLPVHRTLYLMNLGVALSRLSQPKKAYEVLMNVERSRWLEGTPHALTLMSNLTTAAILGGDTKAAKRWMNAAETRTPASKRGLLVLNQALIAAKTGAYAECTRIVQEGWSAANRLVTTHTLSLLTLLRAFSESHHAPDVAMKTLEGARSIRPRSIDYWLTDWPELEEFVVRHGIGEG